MKVAESRFAKSTQTAGVDSGPFLSAHFRRLAAIFVFAVSIFALSAGSASAAEYRHQSVTAEFGSDGTAATEFPSVNNLAFQQANKRLYVLGPLKIYGFSVPAPGTFSTLGGAFPLNPFFGGGGDSDIAVDNSATASANNIYMASDSSLVRGFSSSGSELSVSYFETGGETCGVSVDNEGHIWATRYSGPVLEFEPSASTSIGQFSLNGAQGGPCKVAVDQSNNDIYVSSYGSGVFKYTKASSYATSSEVVGATGSNNRVAVNGAKHRLYVGGGSSNDIQAFDTTTGTLLETIPVGEPIRGITVNEANDTLYVTGSTKNKVKEIPGANVPKAITGTPTGNSTVSGTADLNGAGPITECYFEFGLTTAYGSKQNCTEPTPIAATGTVHAVLPGMFGDETYHYRLVVANGERGSTTLGSDETITPHNLTGLTTEPASNITASAARLNASFEGTSEDTHYYFDWGKSTAYGSRTALPPGDDAGVTSGHTPLHFDLTGLDANTTYHYRIVGENSLGRSKGSDQSFTTPQPPIVDGVLSREVTATSAELVARLNAAGEETTYRFEYGPSISYGTSIPVPDGIRAAGNTTEPVVASLTGLSSQTYHFRFVATNKWGTTTSDDQTFRFYPEDCPNAHLRQQTGAGHLPDCRAYELVSAENAGNAALQAIGPFSATASSPSRFAYAGALGVIPGAGDPPVGGPSDLYVATRHTDGWKTSYVGIPATVTSEVGGPPVYGTPQPQGIFATPGLDMFMDWDVGRLGKLCCGSLGSMAPYVWDSTGNSLGRLPTNLAEIPNSTMDPHDGGFVGDVRPSPDFSHYFFSSSNLAFTPDGLTTGSGSAYDNNIAAGTVKKISVLTGGADIPHEPGALTQDYLNLPAASTNGSHILIEAPKKGNCGEGTCGYIGPGTEELPCFEETPNNGPEPIPCPKGLPSHLYLRVNDSVTYDVTEHHYASFVAMTSNGSKIYFKSDEQVTSDDHDTSADLFVWDEFPTPHITRISTGPGEVGDTDLCSATWTNGCNAEFVSFKYRVGYGFFNKADPTPSDDVIASESGDAYFYSPELLVNGKGIANERNVYVYRGGQVQYVTTLTGKDGLLDRLQISPDGQHVAFLTRQRLTSYDNTSPTGYCSEMYEYPIGYNVHGPRCLEMYTYDLSSGAIKCASCPPDGSAPSGASDVSSDTEASLNGRFMSNDGRTFFTTREPLVTADTDEVPDTYEYVENRPQLISTGTENPDSSIFTEKGLVGVSANGVDVYFTTTSTLVGQDGNGPFVKFYDARTNGGIPFVPPAAPCAAADECHGPGSEAPAERAAGTGAALGDGGNQGSGQHKKKHKKKHKRRHHKHSAGSRIHHTSRNHG